MKKTGLTEYVNLSDTNYDQRVEDEQSNEDQVAIYTRNQKWGGNKKWLAAAMTFSACSSLTGYANGESIKKFQELMSGQPGHDEYLIPMGVMSCLIFTIFNENNADKYVKRWSEYGDSDGVKYRRNEFGTWVTHIFGAMGALAGGAYVYNGLNTTFTPEGAVVVATFNVAANIACNTNSLYDLKKSITCSRPTAVEVCLKFGAGFLALLARTNYVIGAGRALTSLGAQPSYAYPASALAFMPQIIVFAMACDSVIKKLKCPSLSDCSALSFSGTGVKVLSVLYMFPAVSGLSAGLPARICEAASRNSSIHNITGNATLTPMSSCSFFDDSANMAEPVYYAILNGAIFLLTAVTCYAAWYPSVVRTTQSLYDFISGKCTKENKVDQLGRGGRYESDDLLSDNKKYGYWVL